MHLRLKSHVLKDILPCGFNVKNYRGSKKDYRAIENQKRAITDCDNQI